MHRSCNGNPRGNCWKVPGYYIYICLSTWTLQWPFPFKNSERVLALFVASMHLLEIGSMLKGPEGSKSRCLQSILLDKYHYQKSTPKWYHTEFFLKSIFFSDRSFQMLFLGSKSGPEKSCQMDPLDPGQRRRRLWKKCLRLLWFENGKEWSSKKVGLRKRRETLGMCKKQVDYNSTTLKKTHIRRNQVYPGIYI